MPEETQPNLSLLDELLTLTELLAVPKPKPLLNGILNFNSLAWIAGPPGSYKTFLALDYALQVAREHPIIYVAGEGLSGLAQRVMAWEHADGNPVRNTLWLPRSVAVTHTGWYSLIAAAVHVGAKMVVLDTQARMSGGLDENKSNDMGVYIDAVGALKEATGACVLSVHHSSKAGAHLRGSSAVQGAADTIITVEARNKVVGVHNLKQKDIVEFPDEWYRPVNTLDSCVLVPCEKPNDWDTKTRRGAYKDETDA